MSVHLRLRRIWRDSVTRHIQLDGANEINQNASKILNTSIHILSAFVEVFRVLLPHFLRTQMSAYPHYVRIPQLRCLCVQLEGAHEINSFNVKSDYVRARISL